MRVLNVINRFVVGGIETALVRSSPHLHKHGIHVDACCLGPESVLDEEFRNLGGRIWRIPKTANCWRTAKLFGEVLDAEDYDIVHSHLDYTSGGLVMAAARRGIPSLVSLHCCEPLALTKWRDRPGLSTIRSLWLRWHRRLMDRYTDRFLGHSEINLEAFQPAWRATPDRHQVIVNGVPIPAQAPLDRQAIRTQMGLPLDAPVLLHVGSFRREKNHVGLLETFARVRQSKSNAQLVLVGDGALRPEITALAKSKGLSAAVRFEGLQSDVWSYYNAADVFLFPSTSEGFGNAVAESEVAGLPLVASDIPAHRESVAIPQQRFLFPLQDYQRAADMVIEQLEAAEQHDNHWVQASQAYAREHFSMQRYASNLHRHYNEVLSRVKPRLLAA